MQDLDELYQLILERKNNPEKGSYTDYLFTKGLDKILKKVGEEATEVVVAAKNPVSYTHLTLPTICSV